MCSHLESGVELGGCFPLLQLGDGILHASRVLRGSLGKHVQEDIPGRRHG